jgi:cell division protein FtsL
MAEETEKTEERSLSFSNFIKVWLPIITLVVGTFFSIQSWANSTYYTKTEAADLERRISAVEGTYAEIHKQNTEIIEKLGIVQGTLAERGK